MEQVVRCPHCGHSIDVRDIAPPETPAGVPPEKAVRSTPATPERSDPEQR